jgi:polysaccharide biosynthesis protein PslG
VWRVRCILVLVGFALCVILLVAGAFFVWNREFSAEKNVATMQSNATTSASVESLRSQEYTDIYSTTSSQQTQEIAEEALPPMREVEEVPVVQPEEDEYVAPAPSVKPPTPPVSVPKPIIPTYTAQSNHREVGMSLGETLSILSEVELARQLDDMASLGVDWIRVDLAWSTVQESGPNEYRWAGFDRVVAGARARNMQVLAILAYTPEWARRGECAYTKKCEPADHALFARFAQKAVERYAPQGVRAWEVWNEPNLQTFWVTGANPERYTALLKETFTAIRTVDPEAIVVSGGLAALRTQGGNMSAREFLERMYEAGAKSYFTALGYHPYSFPIAPHYYLESSPWSQIADTAWSIRSIMSTYGDSAKKIWITEYGAPTGGPGLSAEQSEHGLPSYPTHVTEAYQAHMLRDAYTENAGMSFTGPLFWYSYKDLSWSTATIENHFGILRPDGSKKSAYDVMREVGKGE